MEGNTKKVIKVQVNSTLVGTAACLSAVIKMLKLTSFKIKEIQQNYFFFHKSLISEVVEPLWKKYTLEYF